MRDRKTQLRAKLREAYAKLDDEYIKQADFELISRVMEFPLYRDCQRIFLFASVGREVNTHPLIGHAFSCGKTVLLPKCHAKGRMEFYEYNGSLTDGRFGIPEPTGETAVIPASEDLMILPGLSFTISGIRMGQGGGYYDRFLEKYPCITVGLCRNVFIQKDIPTMWNDLPVDYVITETTVYKCKNGAS